MKIHNTCMCFTPTTMLKVFLISSGVLPVTNRFQVSGCEAKTDCCKRPALHLPFIMLATVKHVKSSKDLMFR